MTQTIKQHLEAIRTALLDVENHDNMALAQSACIGLEHLNTITAMLDMLMKSAEDWIKDFSDNVIGFLNGGGDRSVEIIRAIQQNAHISQQWQPIETAPKDGTAVILLVDDIVC